MSDRVKADGAPISEPLNLPRVQPELPGLPAVEQSCRRCGSTFPVPARRDVGRPVAFCGEDCRRAAADDQRRAWHAEHDGEGPAAEVECRHCGAAFRLPPRPQGRLPGFCSPACRRAAKTAALAAAKASRRRAWLTDSKINREGD